MAKSIRSKIKRKHRAEFRRTIGTEAAKKQMSIVQAKLKDSIEKGSMNSFERLSNLLETDAGENETGEESMEIVPVDPIETDASLAKGENKVPVKKLRKQKHKKPSASRKEDHKARQRTKPRFFCQF